MPSQAQIPNQQRETPSQSVRVVTAADGWQRHSRAGFSWRLPSRARGLSTAEGHARHQRAKKKQKKFDDDEIRTHAILEGSNPFAELMDFVSHFLSMSRSFLLDLGNAWARSLT